MLSTVWDLEVGGLTRIRGGKCVGVRMSERLLGYVLSVAANGAVVGAVHVGGASPQDLGCHSSHGGESQLLGQSLSFEVGVIIAHDSTVIAHLGDSFGGLRAEAAHGVHDEWDQVNVSAIACPFVRALLAGLSVPDGPIRVMGMLGGAFSKDVGYHPVVRCRVAIVPVIHERVSRTLVRVRIHLYFRTCVQACSFHSSQPGGVEQVMPRNA